MPPMFAGSVPFDKPVYDQSKCGALTASVPLYAWSMVAFTHDGNHAVSHLNGEADLREGRNPYYYPLGLYDGGDNGADFTVRGVNRLGEMGNFFVGLIGGLAVGVDPLSFRGFCGEYSVSISIGKETIEKKFTILTGQQNELSGKNGRGVSVTGR